MCVCVVVCVRETERDRQTDRQTDRQKEKVFCAYARKRKTGTEAGRQTDRQPEKRKLKGLKKTAEADPPVVTQLAPDVLMSNVRVSRAVSRLTSDTSLLSSITLTFASLTLGLIN